MTITLSCPDCGMEYNLKDGAYGKLFPCRGCDATIVVNHDKCQKVEEFDPEYEDEESGRRLARATKQRNQRETSGLSRSPKKSHHKKPKVEVPPEGFIERIGIRNFVTIIVAAIFIFVAVLGLFIPALGKGIAYVGIAIANVMFMIAAVWIYTVAFLEDTTQYSTFLRCLFIPFYVVYYVYTAIDVTWKPVLIAVAAGFLLLVTLSYKNSAEEGKVMNSSNSPRVSETQLVAR